jgi:hypothetical protein
MWIGKVEKGGIHDQFVIASGLEQIWLDSVMI